MIRNFGIARQFKCIFLVCIGVLVLSFSTVGYTQNWQQLRQHLLENQRRFESNLQFSLECRIKSQELILENEFTLPINNSAFLLATNGKVWRYSEVIQGDEKVFFSVYSNNEIRTQDQRMYWSATGVVTDGSEGSYLQGLDFLDFLSFDIGTILEESGFLPKRSPIEQEQMKYQRPQHDLIHTLDTAKQHPEAQIIFEKIDDLNCITVKFGNEFFSVCPKFNYALVQRKAAFPNTDIAKFHLRCTNFFSPGNGLFVPRTVKQIVYGKYSEKPELHNKAVGVVNYRLSKFSFEKPAEGLFHPEFPEGFYVSDFVKGINYEIAEHTTFGQGATQAKELGVGQGIHRKRNLSFVLVPATILFALGIIAVVLGRKRFKHA